MYSLRLTCTADEVDFISGELWEAGTAGIRELDDDIEISSGDGGPGGYFLRGRNTERPRNSELPARLGGQKWESCGSLGWVTFC